MADDLEKLKQAVMNVPNVEVDTAGVPTLYVNQANVTLSFHDLRVYLSEVSPKSIETSQPKDTFTSRQPSISPKLCLVLNPEFARGLHEAIATSLAKYEALFGPLRPNPQPPPSK